MTRLLLLLSLLFVLAVCFPTGTAADPTSLVPQVLFDTGLENTATSFNMGNTVGRQFLGIRFESSGNFITTEVGSQIFHPGSTDPTQESLFAALVALTGPSDYPDTLNLSSDDVLGHVVFSLPPNAESALNQYIVWAPLSVQLFEGEWYALVFGSELFGASGFGVMPPGAYAPSDTFFKTATGTAYHEYTQPFGYFGVLGHPGPPFEVPVPEPSTLLLLSSGLAGQGGMAWRRHRRGYTRHVTSARRETGAHLSPTGSPGRAHE